ncbi:MAG: hypothetical protein OXC82_13195 [Rhodobacteraceae bacterium]|nr:hypothetical protein [Paracoccaceae bacterium]MCY4251375.1 hypothetical protein [Paracoccaceae bacterium]
MAKNEIRYSGAVYTPELITNSMVAHCEELLERKNNLRVLEPSVGDGSFVRALHASNIDIATVSAVDLDERVFDELHSKSSFFRFPLRLYHNDFLEFAMKSGDGTSPDLIIGNPPFINYRNYTDEFRQNSTLLANRCDDSVNHFKNAWLAFALTAEKLLAPDGLLAFVLPYEILTVEYGHNFLQSLKESFHRIDIHVSHQRAFTEIDQDAVILIANRKGRMEPGVFIHRTDSFTRLESGKGKRIQLLEGPQRGLEMNAFLLDGMELNTLREIRQRCSSISDYAGSTPGLVTAANDFFIRNLNDVRELGLENYAKPILRHSSFINGSPVYRNADHEKITCQMPSQFLHFQGDFKKLSKSAKDYIKSGEKQGLHLRYKSMIRDNWFEVPLANPKPGFIFKRSHSHPRIVVNRANILTTDGAYGIIPHVDYSIDAICFSFFNSLTLLFAEMDGRFYGGGVLELTPREFRGLPLVYKEPSEGEFSDFLKTHRMANGRPEPVLDFGDVLLGQMLNIDGDTLQMIRNCWQRIRAHRLRHGGMMQA